MNDTLRENLLSAETVLLALKEQIAAPTSFWASDPEQVTTIVRGLDLATLLMRDATRRMDGRAPAALEAAVQTFLEQADRVLQRQHNLSGADCIWH